jgi:hypothetical protein
MSDFARESVGISLFRRSLGCPKSRIPAEKDRSVADNFLQKQQKQRGPFRTEQGHRH